MVIYNGLIMGYKTQKRLITLVVGLLIVLAGYFAEQKPDLATRVLGNNTPGYYRVADFSDGDTITVNMNGKNERVRFIGVDTPETHDPRKAVQCFGQVAANFTKQLIGTQKVRLEADELSSNRDRYDRILRYVYLPDNRLVNAEIIKQGYGFAYTSFPFTKSEEFVNYEDEARDNNRGLWKSCQPTENQYGNFTSNDAD